MQDALVLILILFSPLVVLSTPVLLVESVLKRRRENQYSLLWLMTVAVERMIPLVPAIEAYARERGGRAGSRARYLAEMLRAGVPLADALDRVPRLLPREARPLVRVGCESGSLATALRQATALRDVHRAVWLALMGKFAYLVVVALIGLGIVSFMFSKIVPAFEAIFKDYGMPLPRMTQWVIDVAHFFIGPGVVLLIPVMIFFTLAILYGVGRYIGLIPFELPGTNWIVRRLDTAAILETLALAVEHRRPLPETIATLAWTYPKWAIRGRLADVAKETAEGADWRESLFAHRLLRKADVAILGAAGRAGNLPWAMREMAESNRRRLAYRMLAAIQMLYPPVLLAYGLVVAVFVVSMFIPLIALIQSLV